MTTCSDIMNCKDYYYCIFCPAQAWLWKRIGRGGKLKMIDNEPLYKCDPNKNIKCLKTACKHNPQALIQECEHTTNKEYVMEDVKDDNRK